MLRELYIKNLVIFAEADIEFAPGLNVISGETGAGKSLIAGALGLALGARANSELIRQGAEQATVSAVFDRPQSREGLAAAAECGLAGDGEETLIFERRITGGKGSRLTLGGRPVSSGAVEPLADALLDIAAQNEHTRLTDSAYQRFLLDRYGRIDTAEYAAEYRLASELHQRLAAGEAQKERVRLELERVRYKLGKIADFAFDPQRDPGLEERITLLSSAGDIRQVAQEGALLLYEGEEALSDQLGRLLRRVDKYAGSSPQMAQAAESLGSALALLEDGARGLSHVAQELDFSEAELDALIARAEEMKALARLLDCPERDLPPAEQIPRMEKALRARETELSAWEMDGAQVRQELDKRLKVVAGHGRKITAARQKAGKKLSAAVNAELKDLGMPQANFEVCLLPLWAEGDEPDLILTRAGSGGLEEVSFRIAPNPGEAPSTLAETASGGEASRAMLAIKSALASAHCPPTLLFDEIDSGVGGRLGAELGRKLYALARDRQVIVITHLPQIAARADRHIKIAKSTGGGRTSAGFTVLEGAQRVEEIAQMIHGQAATDTTRKQAKEMLAGE